MKLPNKATTYKESVISLFSVILSLLEREPLTPSELLNYINSDDLEITDFIGALDCLFALGKINHTQEGGLLTYVIEKN